MEWNLRQGSLSVSIKQHAANRRDRFRTSIVRSRRPQLAKRKPLGTMSRVETGCFGKHNWSSHLQEVNTIGDRKHWSHDRLGPVSALLVAFAAFYGEASSPGVPVREHSTACLRSKRSVPNTNCTKQTPKAREQEVLRKNVKGGDWVFGKQTWSSHL